MIRFTHKGNFEKTTRFFRKADKIRYGEILRRYGDEGVTALRSNTPKDSGETSEAWNYSIRMNAVRTTISWTNSNIVDGIPVVILLQYGHGTRSGSFVQGRDFINPAMRPIFDRIAENLWKEVTSL